MTSLGITCSFPQLCPTPGLVTFALLTLAPLTLLCVRLACLIHAANVHSEPGSNPSKCFASNPLPGRRKIHPEQQPVNALASRVLTSFSPERFEGHFLTRDPELEDPKICLSQSRAGFPQGVSINYAELSRG